jgi:hypothetical protein
MGKTPNDFTDDLEAWTDPDWMGWGIKGWEKQVRDILFNLLPIEIYNQLFKMLDGTEDINATCDQIIKKLNETEVHKTWRPGDLCPMWTMGKSEATVIDELFPDIHFKEDIDQESKITGIIWRSLKHGILALYWLNEASNYYKEHGDIYHKTYADLETPNTPQEQEIITNYMLNIKELELTKESLRKHKAGSSEKKQRAVRGAVIFSAIEEVDNGRSLSAQALWDRFKTKYAVPGKYNITFESDDEGECLHVEDGDIEFKIGFEGFRNYVDDYKKTIN